MEILSALQDTGGRGWEWGVGGYNIINNNDNI